MASVIDDYLEIAAQLGPSGIRRQLLDRELHKVNQEIGAFAPWPVSIRQDLGLAYDSRPVSLCCESEQWRAATVIQILAALRGQEAAIIIDRADILDNGNKNRLFKCLAAMPFTSLVFLKADNREDTLDLSKKGAGVSYWISAGILSEI